MTVFGLYGLCLLVVCKMMWDHWTEKGDCLYCGGRLGRHTREDCPYGGR